MKSKTMLGAEYQLIIISGYMPTPEKLISMQMNADVKHGLLSVRYTGFKFTLDKDNYSFGETIKLRVDCDNSDCSIAVKEIKFKLYLCSLQRFKSG